MLHVIPIVAATATGLDILRKAKQWFYPDKTLSEAEAILRKRMADDVGSLQEQVRDHRHVIDKLVEQVKADKDMIEKHNEVLINLSEAAQQTAASLAKLRLSTYCAVGLAAVSLSAVIFLAIRK